MNRIIEGVNIHFETDGNDGSRVLLLHGWGCDLSMMRPVGDALKSEHRVMMIDFPAHGQSGRPPEPWGVPEYAHHLKLFLESESFFPCSVIAHSFGCRITAYLASEDPSCFDRIVLTGAAGIRREATAEEKARSEQFHRKKEKLQQLKKIPFLRKTAENMENRLREHYGSRDYNALDEEMRKTFVKVINQDLREQYGGIRSSTLLIWGDRDTETPLWMAHEIEKRIPDCGLVLLEGGSHFAYIEQIQRFNTIVSHFLREA